MKFRITADVLYSYTYEIQTVSKAEAMKMVADEELEPIKMEQITSPILTDIQEIK